MIIGDRVERLMEMNDKLPDFIEWTQEMYCEDNMTNKFVNLLYEHLTDAFALSRCLTSRFMEMNDETEE